MSDYMHVMVAVDLSEQAAQVADKAQGLVKAGGRLSLVHVLQPMDSIYLGESYGATAVQFQKIQDDMMIQAKEVLSSLAKKYDCTTENQFLLVGSPAKEIHRIAEQQNVDIIVIGSHGRHGLALLLGSTANAVLHGAGCDVLAVRIAE